LNITIDVGEMLFILGANGTGKSSLMQLFALSNHRIRRITAHRQTWFRSGASEFTGMQRTKFERDLINYDHSPVARWADDIPLQRTQMAIDDLINSENMRSRAISRAYECDDRVELSRLTAKDSAITILNRILRLANLDIVVTIQGYDEIMATKGGGYLYSIAKLSDGERNAILIAANVLTVSKGTLVLIDEPERHLHRSIVSPLLSLLLKERPDCAFIVSTHEPLLPVDNPIAKVLLTRSCEYIGDQATHYDIDILETINDIDDVPVHASCTRSEGLFPRIA
jgi:ABC-type lipoprotein export system ATPase subunit